MKLYKSLKKIHEFAQKETEQSLQARLNDKTCLVLVAENESELLGFKMGYELDNKNVLQLVWWCDSCRTRAWCRAALT